MYKGEILKSTELDVTIQTSKDTLTIDRSQIAHIDLRNSLLLNNKIVEKRYVIVHTEDFDCHIAQCVVGDQLKIVTGYQDDISRKHQNHKNSKRWMNIYNGFTEKPKNEMHIYMQEGLYYKDLFQDDNSNLITLSFDDIEKVEFYSGHVLINSYLNFWYVILSMAGYLVLTDGFTISIGGSGYSDPW